MAAAIGKEVEGSGLGAHDVLLFRGMLDMLIVLVMKSLSNRKAAGDGPILGMMSNVGRMAKMMSHSHDS